MNRLIPRILLSLQLLLFSSVFLLEWSSHKYMTMMRIILFKNRRLESSLPLDTMVFAGKAVLLIIASYGAYALFLRVFRHRDLFSAKTFRPALLVLTAGGAAAHISLNTAATFRTYYFSIVLLLVVCLLQLPAVLKDTVKSSGPE